MGVYISDASGRLRKYAGSTSFYATTGQSTTAGMTQKAITDALDQRVPKTTMVNNKPLTGSISLSASDVGALPSATKIPSKTSELTNDSGYLTSVPSNMATTDTAQTISGSKSFTTHQYFKGGVASSSTSNTSQIVMTKSDGTQQFAITSNDNTFIVNPTTSATTGQLVCNLGSMLYMSGADLGRSAGKWKDLYLSGSIYNNSGNKLTLPSSAGTLALTSQIPAAITVDSALSSTSTNPVQNKVVNSALGGKQETLVSGSNIKTINGETILGAGDIEIAGGGGGLTKSDLLAFIYPVGSIYMSVNNISPQTFLGGTWVAWGAGRVPLAMGSNGETDYTTVEQTGGSENSVASHNHTQASHSHTNSHSHRVLSNTSYSGDIIGYGHNNNSQGFGGIKTNVGTDYYTNDRNGWQNSQSTNGGRQLVESTSITTNSVTPTINSKGTTGGNRMPFITCYMWKRTA